MENLKPEGYRHVKLNQVHQSMFSDCFIAVGHDIHHRDLWPLNPPLFFDSLFTGGTSENQELEPKPKGVDMPQITNKPHPLIAARLNPVVSSSS